MIYRNVCDLKTLWDKEIPRENQNQWLKWTIDLHDKIRLLRSIPTKGKQMFYIDIHLFSDASLTGVCTVAYIVVNQKNISSQNLITSKSRLARKDLSIPRLELVTAHRSANLAEDVKTCLNKLSVRKIYAWSDSTTVPHWLKDNGEYKTFVGNRVSRNKGKSFIEWKSC